VELMLAVLIGALFAGGFYLLMRCSLVKMVFGIALLAHATNLLIFTVGNVARAKAPIVLEGATIPPQPYADPVPQALILTAIVIGFGLQAFCLVLFKRTYLTLGTDDTDEMTTTDTLAAPSIGDVSAPGPGPAGG